MPPSFQERARKLRLYTAKAMRLGGPLGSRPGLVVAIALLAGSVAAVVGFAAVVRSDQASYLTAFRQAAEDRITAIQRQADLSLHTINATQAYWSNSSQVSESEFKRFILALEQGPRGEKGVRLVLWSPKVAAEDRPAYEQSEKRKGRRGITELDAARNLRPASARSVYYPITFISVNAAGSEAYGIDSAGRTANRPFIARAIGTRQICATKRFEMFGDPKGVFSVALYAAVQRNKNEPVGLLTAIVTLQDVVRSAISYLSPGGVTILLEDASAAPSEQLLYVHTSRRSGGSAESLDRNRRFAVTRLIKFADRSWRIVCVPSLPVESVGYTWRNWLLLALGFCLNLFVAFGIRSTLRGQRRVRELVLRRTHALRSVTKAAKQASRAKTQFLANMSHEIRTPLNGIMGMATLQLEASPDDASRETAQTILDSTGHLLEIVNEILDYSKSSAGGLVLRSQTFDPRLEVMRIVDSMRDTAGQKGLVMSVEVDERIAAHLTGDALRVRQVLLNFVSNAIKFTDGGAIAVRVVLQSSTATSQAVKFEVEDTGEGISQADQEKIFQAFVQVDNSDRRTHAGTGLGLALAKNLVELMGGAIACESVKGKGSRFWFKAPFRIAAAMPTKAAPLVGAGPSNFGLRILAAEDNVTNRRVLEKLLGQMGCSCELVEDGLEAVGRASTGSYDLVMLDLQMPKMDGFEAARTMRSRAFLDPGTPIAAVTASIGEEVRERCLEAGIDLFLAKPIHVAELRALLASVEQARTQIVG